MITPTVKIDMSGLRLGIEASLQVSKRSLAETVNTALYWTAVNAKAQTPFVTPERVDRELSVIRQPVIGKRGKALKNKKRYAAGPQVNGAAPLAVLIIQARARAGSRYNVLTAGRYALPASPFKGVSREVGRRAMAAMVDAMIKARHRSGKFILVGWFDAIRVLGPYAAWGSGNASQNRGAYYGNQLGDASPAQPGLRCGASIENDIGLGGQNRASMNRALWEYGSGPLQRSVDGEGRRQMEYGLRKMETKVAAAANRHWS